MFVLRLTRFLCLTSLALVVVAPCRAQGFRVEDKSPPAASARAAGETFTSLDARFSIALPQQISGFRPLKQDRPGGKVAVGDAYSWELDGAFYEVAFFDKSRTPDASADVKDLMRAMSESVAAKAAKGGKVLGNSELDAGGLAGRELRVEFPDKYLVSRFVAAGERVYQVVAAFRKDAPTLDAVNRVLQSFRVLTAAEVEAAKLKKLEAATPAPLPQEPAAKRPTSDAQDAGLRGKVRTVLTEREDLSGTWSVQGRKPASEQHYDEQGYLTKEVLYDYKGNLLEVSAYGYIDGERAALIKTVEHEYNPPPIIVDAGDGKGARPKYDPRYTYKYRFKYDAAGRLREMTMHHSSGAAYLRYVYNYKPDQREEVAYSTDGTVSHRLVYKLDDKGNEAELVVYEGDNKVRARESYAYEFDARGNWTKRVTSEWKTTGGKAGFYPASADYRTITYY